MHSKCTPFPLRNLARFCFKTENTPKLHKIFCISQCYCFTCASWNEQEEGINFNWYITFFLTFLVQNRKSNTCIITSDWCFPLLLYIYLYMNKKGLVSTVVFKSLRNWLPLVILMNISMMINIQHPRRLIKCWIQFKFFL